MVRARGRGTTWVLSSLLYTSVREVWGGGKCTVGLEHTETQQVDSRSMSITYLSTHKHVQLNIHGQSHT